MRAVLLASEDREIPKRAIDLAARIAERSGAPVHVFTIARIWGTTFGFPNPGLFPSRREWADQRRNVERAIARLERKGVEADGRVIGTRSGAKRIVAEARRLGCDAIVMGADPPRARVRCGLHVVPGALPRPAAGAACPCTSWWTARPDATPPTSPRSSPTTRPSTGWAADERARRRRRRRSSALRRRRRPCSSRTARPPTRCTCRAPGRWSSSTPTRSSTSSSPASASAIPSLLTGLAPAFTVRAREDATCLLLPRDAAMRVFAHPAGARYVAARAAPAARAHRAHRPRAARAEHDPARRARAPARRCSSSPDATIRDAAAAMTAAHVTAALVRRPGADGHRHRPRPARARPRRRALADEPVTVAVRDALLAPEDRTASEALVDLLDAERRELCVTARDGRIVGVLTVEDIAGGEHSPFALRREIARAPDADGARRGRHRRHAAAARIAAVGRAGARRHQPRAGRAERHGDTARLIELAFARHGPAPVPWAWLALGSVARRELTPASDQDNALAYADEAAPEDDALFARVAADVNAGLARCGLGEDHAAVLARDPRWRMTAGRWHAVFRECLEHPDRSHLVRAAVAFDFRQVAGGLDVVAPLAAVIRDARRHPDFIARLARTATDWKVSVSRRGFCHRPPRAHRPQARRGAPDRQPRAPARLRGRDHDLRHDRPPRRRRGGRAPRRRDGVRAARRVRDRLAHPPRAPRRVPGRGPPGRQPRRPARARPAAPRGPARGVAGGGRRPAPARGVRAAGAVAEVAGA